MGEVLVELVDRRERVVAGEDAEARRAAVEIRNDAHASRSVGEPGGEHLLDESAQDVREQDTFEAFDRFGAAVGLRKQNRALQRGDDEAGDVVGVELGPDLTGRDRCAQAVRECIARFRIGRDQARANRFAVFARLGRK